MCIEVDYEYTIFCMCDEHDIMVWFVMITEEEDFCLVHFINDGVTVDGDTATLEFEGLGNFEDFLCDLDREGLQPCE